MMNGIIVRAMERPTIKSIATPNALVEDCECYGGLIATNGNVVGDEF
jgi:hypothetical protein